MKKLITSLNFALLLTLAFGQTVDKGKPLGWKDKTPGMKSIPSETMSGFDMAQIKAEDAVNDTIKSMPWRFGYKYSTNLSLDNAGQWTTMPDGDRLWQLSISCPNAMTVNLLFENFHLPEGAYLYLYDEDKTNVVGAYTHDNNREDKLLGSELVHGDQIVVEYFVPQSAKQQGSFTIANVIHGYRSLNHVQNNLEKSLNDSEDCNIDVNCPLGTGWDEQIRSVAMIVVNGNGACTGALINNTCDDATPYFLTANHCLSGQTGSWAFRFNWNSPPGTESCATTAGSTDPGPPYDQTANGATQLVSDGGSDFALVKIDNLSTTEIQNWGLFFAGWNNDDTENITQATGIHHPSGDVKKICREDDDPYHDTRNGAQVWLIDDWDQGVTEPGSSGSPLFDQNGRIIGQLYGGTAACNGTTDNNQEDYYGRLGVSWNNGLSNYLAGSCGSATTNNGYDPITPPTPDDAGITSIDAPSGTNCTINYDPEVTLYNYGTNTITSVTINYDIDGGTNNTFSWSGSLAAGNSTTVTLPTITTTGGPHNFNASTSLPNGNTDTDPGNDQSTGTFTAVANGQPITLDLQMDCYGSEVTWEIVDNGGNILYSGGPYSNSQSGTNVTENLCLAPGCYDFIIYDDFGDGMNGSAFNCTFDGTYSIIDDNSGTELASLIAPNADYGNQETNNFCVTIPCGMTISASTTEEDCKDDDDGSISLNVSNGAAPYTYNIGSGYQSNNTFNNLAQGNYSITVQDDTGCVQTKNVTLSGPAQISASTNVSNETASNNGAIDLIPNGGTQPFTFSWSGPGSFSSTNEDISGLSAGMYSVDITDDNGCVETVNNIEVQNTVSLEEQKMKFSIYPNPTSGRFKIRINSMDAVDMSMKIVDINGKVVLQKRINQEETISTQGWSSGVYFIQFRSKNLSRTRKIVKSR